MFKKTERLSTAEFNTYFQIGKKNHSKYFTIITHPYTECKVAVVVGKKVSKKAVTRNTIRRRIYNQLKQQLDQSNYSGILIIITKPPYTSLSNTAADELLTQSIAEVTKGA